MLYMESIKELEIDIVSKINITFQQKLSFFSSILIGIIAHLYQMTNVLLNDDTVMSYYRLHNPYSLETLLGNIGNDRWLLSLSEMTITWFKTPMVAGVVILLLCAFFSALYVELFEVRSNIGAILCGAIISSFPTITSYMSLYSVGYMLSAFLALLGVYIWKKRKAFLSTTLIFMISLAIFPVNIMSIMVAYIYILILYICSAEKFDRKSFKSFVLFVFLILIQAIILMGGMKLRIALTGEAPSAYQGAASVASGEFLFNFVDNILEAFSKTRIIRLSHMQQLPKLKFTIRICYIIQIACIGHLFIAKKIYKERIRSVSLIIAVCFMPIALSAFSVISPGFAYSSQHRMQWVFVLCGTWCLFETSVNELLRHSNHMLAQKVSKSAFIIVAINLCVMIYGFVIFDNVLYFNSQYVYEKDASFLTRILANLDSIDEFDYSKTPVFFIPIVQWATSDTTLSPLNIEPELYNCIVWDTDTNLWAYGDDAVKSHMVKFEGVQFASPPAEVVQDICSKNEVWSKQYDYLKPGQFEIVEYSDIYVVIFKTYIGYSWQSR